MKYPYKDEGTANIISIFHVESRAMLYLEEEKVLKVVAIKKFWIWIFVILERVILKSLFGKNCVKMLVLKVHKREKFFGSDFEFFTIL
jgi:hypothetical protein